MIVIKKGRYLNKSTGRVSRITFTRYTQRQKIGMPKYLG